MPTGLDQEEGGNLEEGGFVMRHEVFLERRGAINDGGDGSRINFQGKNSRRSKIRRVALAFVSGLAIVVGMILLAQKTGSSDVAEFGSPVVDDFGNYIMSENGNLEPAVFPNNGDAPPQRHLVPVSQGTMARFFNRIFSAALGEPQQQGEEDIVPQRRQLIPINNNNNNNFADPLFLDTPGTVEHQVYRPVAPQTPQQQQHQQHIVFVKQPPLHDAFDTDQDEVDVEKLKAELNQEDMSNAEKEENALDSHVVDNDDDTSSQKLPALPTPSASPTIIPKSMRQDMDSTSNPCQHFHKYACGGFDKRAKIPADQLQWSRAWDSTSRVNRKRLRKIVAADRGRVGRYFRACMDVDKINKKGASPLRPYLLAIDTIRNENDFIDTLAYLHRINVPAFFDWNVIANPLQPGRNGFSLLEGGLTLPDATYYTRASMATLRTDYLNIVRRYLELTGVPPSRSADDAESAVQIEEAIAAIFTPRDKERSSIPKGHTLAELDQLAPGINFPRFFAKLAGEDLASYIGRIPPNADHLFQQLQKSQQLEDRRFGAGASASPSSSSNAPFISSPQDLASNILYSNGEYFTAVSRLITSKGPQALKPYLRWRTIFVLGADLGDDFLKVDLELNRRLEGVSKQSVRWRKCLNSLTTAMPDAIGKLYIRHFFKEESRQTALSMLAQIREILRHRLLNDIHWMQPHTRSEAVNKLDHMLFEVGYPTKWSSYYFRVDRNNFFENTMHARLDDVDRALVRLTKGVDRRRWGSTSVTDVDAYYSRQMNTLFVPAGILQPPFFSPSFAPARNWGGIGVVLSHEVTHSMDDVGRKFDEYGHLRNWWTPSDLASFNALTGCISRQYSSYSLHFNNNNYPLDGNLTLGEAIADEGGLRLAYTAMHRGLDLLNKDINAHNNNNNNNNNGNQPTDVVRRAVENAVKTEGKAAQVAAQASKTNNAQTAASRVFSEIAHEAVARVQEGEGGMGISLAENKLFFLSWGQTWCSVTRPKARLLKLLTDEHAPDKFRIIGPLSQMPEFAETFSCPLGSTMHPEHTCQLW